MARGNENRIVLQDDQDQQRFLETLAAAVTQFGLRTKPNIKWDKDRGKDVVSAPWYKKFKGDRINDHHLTLTEKREAKK